MKRCNRRPLSPSHLSKSHILAGREIVPNAPTQELRTPCHCISFTGEEGGDELSAFQEHQFLC
jgi:hypothetical protein